MFIVSKRNYQIRRADGSSFFLAKDFIGHIPHDVAQSNLVQRAIRGGMIVVPEGTKDKQLEQADNQAAEKAAGKDIRPDATFLDEAEGKAGVEKFSEAEDKAGTKEQTEAEGNKADYTENSEEKKSGKRSQKK